MPNDELLVHLEDARIKADELEAALKAADGWDQSGHTEDALSRLENVQAEISNAIQGYYDERINFAVGRGVAS